MRTSPADNQRGGSATRPDSYQGIDQYLRPTHSFFSYDLIATVIPSERNLATNSSSEGSSPLTLLAHATESHITPREKVLYTAKAHNTGAKRGPSMRKLGRSTTIRCLVLGVLVLAATSCSKKHSSVAEQIAKTYGLDSFGQIDAIRYTFNLQFPTANVSRSWVWEPKTGQVSYEGKDKDGKPVKATYVRSQLSSQSRSEEHTSELQSRGHLVC